MNTRALYWLKRDFRLTDNPALTAALAAHEEVVPFFVLEPSALAAPETSEFHVHAQTDAFNGLYSALREQLGEKSAPLGFAHREVVELLADLYAAEPFAHLVSHRETGGNRTYDRDKAVAKWCAEHDVTWTEHQQTGVFRGPLDRDKRHKDWEKFYKADILPVPVAEQLTKLSFPAAYAQLLALPTTEAETFRPTLDTLVNVSGIEPKATSTWRHDADLYGTTANGPLRPEHFSFTLSKLQRAHVQPVNEAAAGVTLKSFLNERAINYSRGMSSPNTAFYHCSRLSVHFAWGTMSGRQAYRAVHQRIEELKESTDKKAGTWRRNLRSFASRLHWRDHFTQRLETEVEMEHRPLNPNFWELKLENDPEKLAAWRTGTTGYPMVDACIRCMAVTGYVNFRMRAMLTSTAAHMLHLDFRSIDKPMAQLYTDYEPGIHLAQLQMQAGMVGINTLRTYSPEKQIIDQDPECAFIHHWIPELRPFDSQEVIKRDLTVGLGDYPAVIVNRTERVKAYRKLIGDLKFRPGGREITDKVFAKHGSRRGPRKRKAKKKPASLKQAS